MKLFLVHSRWDIFLVRAETTTEAFDLVGNTAWVVAELYVEGEAKIILREAK